MIKVGVVGATGYTGLELCRLGLGHSQVTFTHLFSKQHVGKDVASLFPHLGDALPFVYEAFDPEHLPKNIDVLFLALPHGQSHAFLPNLLKSGVKVIDLSADFRLSDPKIFEKYYGEPHQNPQWLKKIPLGVTEIYRQKIAKAQAVANPGCYSTGSIFALYPLSQEGVIRGSVVIDAKSGVTGAGKSLKETYLYCEANEALSAYSTGVHRHSPEIEQVTGASVLFSPHLTPMNRGILATIYLDNPDGITESELEKIYAKHYKKEPFVKVIPKLANPSTKYVSGSNICMISFKIIEKPKKIVLFAAIDNLLKGASGQAVQNMNAMCGIKETEGLNWLPNYV